MDWIAKTWNNNKTWSEPSVEIVIRSPEFKSPVLTTSWINNSR